MVSYNRHPDGSVQRPEGSRAGMTRPPCPRSLLAALVGMTQGGAGLVGMTGRANGKLPNDVCVLVQTAEFTCGAGAVLSVQRRGCGSNRGVRRGRGEWLCPSREWSLGFCRE